MTDLPEQGAAGAQEPKAFIGRTAPCDCGAKGHHWETTRCTPRAAPAQPKPSGEFCVRCGHRQHWHFDGKGICHETLSCECTEFVPDPEPTADYIRTQRLSEIADVINRHRPDWSKPYPMAGVAAVEIMSLFEPTAASGETDDRCEEGWDEFLRAPPENLRPCGTVASDEEAEDVEAREAHGPTLSEVWALAAANDRRAAEGKPPRPDDVGALLAKVDKIDAPVRLVLVACLEHMHRSAKAGPATERAVAVVRDLVRQLTEARQQRDSATYWIENVGKVSISNLDRQLDQMRQQRDEYEGLFRDAGWAARRYRTALEDIEAFATEARRREMTMEARLNTFPVIEGIARRALSDTSQET